MKPLSARTRRAYFFTLTFIFVVALLPLALYANGWRFNSVDGLVRTGGIYLQVSSTGVTAYIDGKEAETNNLLQRNIFVQNLAPAEYEFSVSKEGFRPWSKRLAVRSQKVTEARPLLIPESPERIDIPELLSLVTSTATGTKPATIQNPEYTVVAALFNPVVSTATATPSQAHPLEKTSGRLKLLPEGKTLVASWHGSPESAPFYFCTTGTCIATTTVTFAERVLYADFYPGEHNFVLVTLPSGVYAAELDVRSTVMVAPLVVAPGAEFRIGSSGKVFIQEGELLSELVL